MRSKRSRFIPSPRRHPQEPRRGFAGRDKGDCVNASFDFVAQVPPEPARILRPQQNPKAALVWSGTGAPFVIEAAEPPKVFEKLVAERRFEPGEILALRGPGACELLLAALLTQSLPQRIRV